MHKITHRDAHSLRLCEIEEDITIGSVELCLRSVSLSHTHTHLHTFYLQCVALSTLAGQCVPGEIHSSSASQERSPSNYSHMTKEPEASRRCACVCACVLACESLPVSLIMIPYWWHCLYIHFFFFIPKDCTLLMDPISNDACFCF